MREVNGDEKEGNGKKIKENKREGEKKWGKETIENGDEREK